MFSRFLLAAGMLTLPLISHSMEDNRYQKALDFRDYKIQGYTKEESIDEAEKLFQTLALENNAKAMHNFALIQYNKKKYELAFEWFEKASFHGISASKNNIERMQKEGKIKKTLHLDDKINWNDMPAEIIFKICKTLDDYSLIQLRKTEKRADGIVEWEFKRRSPIKTPLSCLSKNGINYTNNNTISYFMRKKLKQAAAIEIPFSTEIAQSFKRYSDFCDKIDYPAKNLMNFFSEGNFPSLKIVKNPCLNKFYNYLNDVQNPDQMELKLIFFTNFFSENLDEDEKARDEFLRTAQKLVEMKRIEIAIFYLNWAGTIVLNKEKNDNAKFYYLIAANLGDAFSQCNLGFIFVSSGDSEQAKFYLKKAAQQGNVKALNSLSTIFLQEKNINSAKFYLIKAAEQKNISALCTLAEIYEDENNINLAKKTYQIAADLGDSMSQCMLGNILEKEGDVKQAIAYYRKAIFQGEPVGGYCLAQVLKKEGDMEQAKFYLKISANEGFVSAQGDLGSILYQEGNNSQAKIYLEMAAEAGDDQAQNILGVILKSEGNNELAEHYYTISAKQGNADAQYNLGRLYEKAGDIKNAKTWYQMAVNQKHILAIHALKELN